ncbi:MAG: MarR family winged helix-turn-helix transcriptional regulator [Acidimicrobiia bacterium]
MTKRLASTRADELSRAERDIRAKLGDQPFDFRAMAAISNIYRAATSVRNHMEQSVLAERNLSWAAFTVLWVLWIWDEQETRALAAEAGITKGTLTGVVNTLEGRSLVKRRRHPSDGRLVLVKLTARGRRLIETLFPRFNAEEVIAASALSTKEQEQLARLLRKITLTMDEAS